MRVYRTLLLIWLQQSLGLNVLTTVAVNSKHKERVPSFNQTFSYLTNMYNLMRYTSKQA
jgi:hypothetical protein